MPAIKMTVTNNLQVSSNGYSGVQKHTEHDEEINHSNKDIDFDFTKFNVYENTRARRKSVEDFNEKKFAEYVKQHDEEQREKGHPERQYGDVKRWLDGKKKATGVLTIGNLETTNELMKVLCPKDSYINVPLKDGSEHLVFKIKDKQGHPIKKNIAEAKKFYGVYNRALQRTTNNGIFINMHDKNGKQIRKTYFSDYLFIGRRSTNVDELGAPHIHFEIGTFGMTKGGKKRGPHETNSLNQALISLYHDANNKWVSGRTATTWYRDKLDKYALQNFQDELSKTYGVGKDFVKFERKTKEDPTVKTGLSMEQLKAQKAEIAKHKQELAQLDKQKAEAKKQADDMAKVREKAQNALKSSYEAITGKKAIHKDNTPLSPLEMTKALSKHTKKLTNDAENAEKRAQEAEAKAQDAEEQAKQKATTVMDEAEKLIQRINNSVQEKQKEEAQEQQKLEALQKQQTTLQAKVEELKKWAKGFFKWVEDGVGNMFQANYDRQHEQELAEEREIDEYEASQEYFDNPEKKQEIQQEVNQRRQIKQRNRRECLEETTSKMVGAYTQQQKYGDMMASTFGDKPRTPEQKQISNDMAKQAKKKAEKAKEKDDGLEF